MRAFDLFVKAPVAGYRKSINPPYRKRDVISIGATLFILAAIPLTVLTVMNSREVRKQAGGVSGQPISPRASNQSAPDIQGNKIVWLEAVSVGQSDVYVYDLSNSTEKKVTASPGNFSTPSIWGDKVIWSEGKDAYLYNLSNSSQTKIVSGTSESPLSIWNDKI